MYNLLSIVGKWEAWAINHGSGEMTWWQVVADGGRWNHILSGVRWCQVVAGGDRWCLVGVCGKNCCLVSGGGTWCQNGISRVLFWISMNADLLEVGGGGPVHATGRVWVQEGVVCCSWWVGHNLLMHFIDAAIDHFSKAIFLWLYWWQ